MSEFIEHIIIQYGGTGSNKVINRLKCVGRGSNGVNLRSSIMLKRHKRYIIEILSDSGRVEEYYLFD